MGSPCCLQQQPQVPSWAKNCCQYDAGKSDISFEICCIARPNADLNLCLRRVNQMASLLASWSSKDYGVHMLCTNHGPQAEFDGPVEREALREASEIRD